MELRSLVQIRRFRLIIEIGGFVPFKIGSFVLLLLALGLLALGVLDSG